MRLQRVGVAALVFFVVAGACSGDSSEDDPTEPTAAIGEPTEPTPGADIDLRRALDAAGVVIVDDPATAPPMTGLQLWEWQVESMQLELETGNGYLGAQLDGVAGTVGGIPFSYLLAGWMESAVSASAMAAAEMMGDQPLDEAPLLGYPTAVLALFVADAVQVALEDQNVAVPTAMPANVAQSGICSTLANWVNRALDFVFNALKVDVQGSGFFSWLGTIWNAAVDLARDAVVGIIETLTAPVVSLIRDALAVVATVSMAGSLLSRWWIDVEPSNKAFLLPSGDEPPREETFTARVDTKIDFEWDDYIVDCARVANLDLPDPTTAAGSPVSWEVTGFPQFGTLVDSDDRIDGDNEATLEWKSTVEETAEGDTRTGWVWAHATVVNNRFENLKTMLGNWIRGKISGIPFEDEVNEGIAALLEPILDKLVKLVEFRGQGGVAVVYHVPEHPNDASVTILDPTTGCEVESPDEIIVDPETVGAVIGDGIDDSLPYLVRVDGIAQDQADDVVLKVYAESRAELQAHIDLGVKRAIQSAIEPVPVGTGRLLDDGAWILGGAVPLGEDGESLIDYVMWAWIELPGGGQEEDFLLPFSYGEPGDDNCLEEDALDVDFRYLEQRHNIWVNARVRGDGDTSEQEYRLELVSIDSDPTIPSTVTINDEASPITPLGLEGYSHPVVVVSAGNGNTTASAGLDFSTEVGSSRIRISGLYERALTGSAGEETDSSAIGVASSGVLFTFDGGPMDVAVAWPCTTLDVGLMSIEVDDDGTRRRGDVLIDNNADECTGRYEGTLQPGTTYQLLASVGIFDERYANDGKVWSLAGVVLCECPAYNVNEAGDFRLDLTPVG